MTEPRPDSPADPAAPVFPDDRALCEQCGYPLKGLSPTGTCPECGTPIPESHPDLRTGPAFESGRGPVSYLATAWAVFRHPKRTYRGMRIASSNRAPRLFLAINATLSAVLFVLAVGVRPPQDFGELDVLVLLLGAAVVFIAVYVLSYIEVLGMTWVCRRRGWRLSIRVAERVAGYATVGWLPSAVAMGIAVNLAGSDYLQDAWRAVGGPRVFAVEAAWVFLFLLGVAGMLVFESLVWIGVRQVKFANTRPIGTENPDKRSRA